MKALSRPSVLLWLALPVSLFLIGCGPSGPPRYIASGKIVFNGSVLTTAAGAPPGSMPVLVRLVADVDAANPSTPVGSKTCLYDAASGQFKTTGDDGKGVEAGKYHLVVEKSDDAALTAKFKKGKTPVIVEIKAPDVVEPAVVDLSKF